MKRRRKGLPLGCGVEKRGAQEVWEILKAQLHSNSLEGIQSM